MTFGQRIKDLRKFNRITQRDLANKIGVDFTYISKIENGALVSPSENVIIKMATTLNTEAEELILLAKKIPTTFQHTIATDDLASMFLRTVTTLSEDQKKQIREIIKGD
ncbi:MAG: helix-turn-helix transcriptional regulator [Anaerovoracaceae bacterium]